MSKKQSNRFIANFTDESVIQGWMHFRKTGEFPVQKVHVGPPEYTVCLPDIYAHPEIDRDYIKPTWGCCVAIGRCVSDGVDVAYGSWTANGTGGYKRDLGATAFKLLDGVFDAVFHEAINSIEVPSDSEKTAFNVALQQFAEFSKGVLSQLPSQSFASVYWVKCAREAEEYLWGFRSNIYLLSKRFGEMDVQYGTNGRACLVNSIACTMKADWRIATEKHAENDKKGPDAALVDKAKRIEGLFADHLVKDPCLMNALQQTLQQLAREAVKKA